MIPRTLLISLFVIAAGYYIKTWLEENRDVNPDVVPLSVLSEAASDINKQLPAMIDKDTEVMYSRAAEGEFSFHNRMVNVTLAELTGSGFVESDLETKIRPGAVHQNCTNPELRDGYLEKGVNLKFVYYDKDKKRVGSFTVSAEDCDF